MSTVAKVSVSFVLVATLFVIIEGQSEPTYYFKNHPTGDLSQLNWWTWDSSVVRSIGSVVFTLSFSGAVFPAYNSLTPRSSSTLHDMNLLTVITGVILCFSMGLSGYLAFGDITSDNILNSFSSGSVVSSAFKILGY